MKKTLSFFLKAVIFLAILALLLAPLQELMARKSLTSAWDMTNKIGGFYNEPEDEFDVMFFGSSHAYAAFSPLALWEETGVKSYVFATQQQPLWATYTYIQEALKSQSPSLIVVEVNMAMDDQEYYDEGVTYSYMDDIPLSWEKAKLAWVSAPDMEERVELLFNFIKYHSRWSELTETDFTFDRDAVRDPYKGFVLLDPQAEPQPRPDIEGITERKALLEKNETWLRNIIQLCQDKGIELWLVKSPSNLTETEKTLLNTVSDIAAESGVLFHDFNEDYFDIGLSGNDYYDKRHLDGHGADLFTRYFSQWMTERAPNLPTDSEDDNWEADLAAYKARLDEQK